MQKPKKKASKGESNYSNDSLATQTTETIDNEKNIRD